MFVGYDIIGVETERQDFIIRNAMDLVICEYLKHIDDVINIDVYITNDIGDVLGLVSEEDEGEYTILLNKSLLNNELELFKTCCHEMMHVVQYVKMDLIHLPYGKYSWQGTIMDTVEYNERPWEIQAYSVEKKLACLFVNNQQ